MLAAATLLPPEYHSSGRHFQPPYRTIRRRHFAVITAENGVRVVMPQSGFRHVRAIRHCFAGELAPLLPAIFVNTLLVFASAGYQPSLRHRLSRRCRYATTSARFRH